MHGEHRILWSLIGILVVCGAVALSLPQKADLDMSRVDARLRNLSTARRIEVHDRLTQRVLHGEFRPLSGSSSETINAAPLMATVATSANAVGRAEIELVRHPNGTLVQEIEVDVAGLAADSTFDLTIDGEWLGTLVTNRLGTAEFEQFGLVRETAKSGD